MESKQNNMNTINKATKKTGRPKKTGSTSIAQQTSVPVVSSTSIAQQTSVPVVSSTSIAQQTSVPVVIEKNEYHDNVGTEVRTTTGVENNSNPNMVDRAMNTVISALREPPKELNIPLNLEPFTYDEILDYSDDLDLSYSKGRAIERERDEMRYAPGYRHEVIINDKSIGHAIFHNVPGKSYWNGYINIEPTYCNPFIVQSDITRINFLGCQLKEVTYIDDEHFGFDHLD
jgi:hypothetical protein